MQRLYQTLAHEKLLKKRANASFAENFLLPLIKFVRELPYIPWLP